MLLGNRDNNVYQADWAEVLTGIKQVDYTNFARDTQPILEGLKGPLNNFFNCCDWFLESVLI